MKFIVLYMLFLSWSSLSRSSDLHTSILYLEQDFSPIEKQTLPPSGLTGSIDEQLNQQSDFYDSESRRLDQERDNMGDSMAPVVSTSPQTNQDNGDVKTGIQWQNLKVCIDKVRQPLERSIALKLSAPSSQELAALESQLNLFRSGSESGILCGEYFKATRSRPMGKTDQFKLMMTLNKILADREKIESILEAFWAAFHLEAPSKSRSLWQLIYQRRIYQAYFNIEME